MSNVNQKIQSKIFKIRYITFSFSPYVILHKCDEYQSAQYAQPQHQNCNVLAATVYQFGDFRRLIGEYRYFIEFNCLFRYIITTLSSHLVIPNQVKAFGVGGVLVDDKTVIGIVIGNGLTLELAVSGS